MEFLDPFPLPSSDSAVASFLSGVCRAAAALHARGFIHRDIKPANILSRDGVPVLIDFGLAKESGGNIVSLGPNPSIVEGRAVGVGTPGYSAPEQFSGGDISPAADIHAIGVLANDCFIGKPPLCWRRIIRHATSSLPSERYPNVRSLARAVRLRHLPKAFGIAAVAVALAVTVAAQFASHRSLPPTGSRGPMVAQKTQPVILNLAEELGPPLGFSGKDWMTSQAHPWQIDPDIPGAIRSGDGILGMPTPFCVQALRKSLPRRVRFRPKRRVY